MVVVCNFEEVALAVLKCWLLPLFIFSSMWLVKVGVEDLRNI